MYAVNQARAFHGYGKRRGTPEWFIRELNTFQLLVQHISKFRKKNKNQRWMLRVRRYPVETVYRIL